MKANELRIGNYLYPFKDQAHKVVGIVGNLIGLEFEFNMVIQDDIKNIEPIPLTEKWLLKFGFEKSNSYNNFRVKAEKNYYHSVKEYKGRWIYSNDDSDAACHTVASIEYVHQLQNLYFALTGEELTIQP